MQKGKERASLQDSASSLASSLLSGAAVSAVASTSSAAASSLGKQQPQTGNAVRQADVHADQANIAASASAPRSFLPIDSNSNETQSEFDNFASPTPATATGIEVPSQQPSAVFYSSRDYDPAEIAAYHAQDGAEVLQLLSSGAVEDDVVEPLDLGPLPQDPADLYISPETTPYLYYLLTSSGNDAPQESDGSAILRYLQHNQYTQDVYGLPETVRETMRVAAAEEAGPEREIALRRLQLLGHQISAGSTQTIQQSSLDALFSSVTL